MSSPDTESASTLTLEFPDSRNVRNTCCLSATQFVVFGYSSLNRLEQPCNKLFPKFNGIKQPFMILWVGKGIWTRHSGDGTSLLADV